MYETVPGPLAMPGILIDANRSSGDATTDDSGQQLASVRTPLTRASDPAADVVAGRPDVTQMRSYLESLPIDGRLIEIILRSGDGDRECAADAAEEDDAQSVRRTGADRNNHVNRFYR